MRCRCKKAKSAVYGWAVRLPKVFDSYPTSHGLCRRYYFGHEHPSQVDGYITAVFRSRDAARKAAKGKDTRGPVKVLVTVEEVIS